MPAAASENNNGKKKGRRKSGSSHAEDGGGTFEVYQSAAMTFQSTGQFQKAIENYTKALEMREGDKNCLVARSICYLELGDPDKALADAEATLKDDKNYIKGILQRAEAYYQKGQFEFALMHYHRGNELRPEVKAFRLGIQKSQEAIDNCIGGAAGIKLSKEGDLSYFYEEQQNGDDSSNNAQRAAKQEGRRAGYGRPSTRERQREAKRQRAAQDQKTVKQLLGELYADKQFLEGLLKETESAGNQSQTNKEVQTLAEDCLNYLDTRTQFWQQQQPMYSRKKKTQPKTTDKDTRKWIIRQLERIDTAQSEGRFEDSLKLSKNTLKKVEQLSEQELPNRHEVVANLHSCIGNAYLELGKYNKALQHHTTDKEIADQRDLEDAKSRSCDNMGRVYARMGEYEKAIKVWEEKIPRSKSSLESTWLFHEIGRCHLELGHHEEALTYGNKSLDAANEVLDDVWRLNATVLIAQCQVKLEAFEEAVESFEQSLDMARLQDDRAAELAIKRAIDDVNTRIAERVRQESSPRQQQSESPKPEAEQQREVPPDNEVVDEDHDDKKIPGEVSQDNEVVESQDNEVVDEDVETQVQKDAKKAKEQEKPPASKNTKQKENTTKQSSQKPQESSSPQAKSDTGKGEGKGVEAVGKGAGTAGKTDAHSKPTEGQPGSEEEPDENANTARVRPDSGFWPAYNQAVDEKLRTEGKSDPFRPEPKPSGQAGTTGRAGTTGQAGTPAKPVNTSPPHSTVTSASSSSQGEYDFVAAQNAQS